MTHTEDRKHIENVLPLSRVDFLVLLSLLDGDRHGYGIVKEIGYRTDGKVQLLPGNLYVVLNRLKNNGLIDRVRKRTQQESGDARRRYYRITQMGKKALASDASSMRALVQEPAVRYLLEQELP